MPTPSKLSLNVIDQWLKYIVLQGECPGFQVSIRKGTALIFDKAYGFANVTNKEKYSPYHLSRIASQSKVFTSTLALDFVARGLLKLEESLTDFIPELNLITKGKKKIQIQCLLTNKSPLIRDSYRNDYWIPTNTFPTATELVDEIATTALVNKSRDEVKYSNLGYALMGLVLEKIGRKPFHELFEEYLSRKLPGVTIATDYSPKLKFATGYIRGQIDKRPFKSVSHRRTHALAPAAGFCSNTRSTTKFFAGLYLEKSILPRKQSNLLLSVKNPVPKTDDEYGLGTIFTTINGHTYLGHSGGFPGFSSHTWVHPKMNLAIGFSTNVSVAKTINFIRGMCELIEIVDYVFPSSQRANVLVSPPMADNYGSTIYVVGHERAVGLPISGFLPTEDVMVFKKYKGRFYSDNISGYKPSREPLDFIIKSRQVIAAKFGGATTYPLK